MRQTTSRFQPAGAGTAPRGAAPPAPGANLNIEQAVRGMDPDRAASWAGNAWATSAQLREEFPTREACAAFARATAAGLVRRLGAHA